MRGKTTHGFGRSMRLGGLGLGNFDGTQSESSGKERHYHCELQEEMQPKF